MALAIATTSAPPPGRLYRLNPLNKDHGYFLPLHLTRDELATCAASALGDGKHGPGTRQASRLLLAALRSGRAAAQEHAEAAVDAEAAVEAVADEGVDLEDDDDAAPAPGVEEQAQR
jgi:hypothetical protein